MRAISRYLTTVVVAVLFASLPVHAQETTGDKHFSTSVRNGLLHRVYIMETTSDKETVGRLLELAADTVRVLVDGQLREFRLDNVRWIDLEGDSLKNGAIIGAVIMGTWCALVCGQGLDDGSMLVPAVAANTAFGALIGVAIDAMNRGRTNLYRNPLAICCQAGPRIAVAFHVTF